jgi:hypothetical protein
MNEHLRDRIVRRLEAVSDERGYQVLDYVEFLESKYAERQSPNANVFTKLTEAVEDKLRAGRVSATVIAETMGVLNRASGVLNGALAAAGEVWKSAGTSTPEPSPDRKSVPAKDRTGEEPPERSEGTAK